MTLAEARKLAKKIWRNLQGRKLYLNGLDEDIEREIIEEIADTIWKATPAGGPKR